MGFWVFNGELNMLVVQNLLASSVWARLAQKYFYVEARGMVQGP